MYHATHFLPDYSLKAYNSFQFDVRARFFAAFQTTEMMQELLEQYQWLPYMPIHILGGGSNILFTRDVDGLVLRNELNGIELVNEDADHYYVKAMAGENWHRFVCYCIEQGYAGLENLSLIPGSVGASPMQNIGAYGVEIKDVFHSLEAWHINEKHKETFYLKDCEFGYRESVFKEKYRNRFIITSVTYRLRKQPVFQTSYGAITQELEKMGVTELSSAAIAKAVINIRRSKLPDPEELGNAGSFFKNPSISISHFERLHEAFPDIVGYPLNESKIKLAAGWLIEQCGWKGYRKGDAGCHEKQALVLVNYGNATGGDIFRLSTEIIESVYKKFGVRLDREVNLI
ncbi:UDP-N-acetylmuramate dehydrogenase [Sediminibacterium sp.]|uniref:UDP-N-acetylmuramate dehydrogenase n=1 Tax=Sediminibacterium sp. TaxID=1917865 RepID=UPI0025D56B73|nr:UDP-N-acetylmuramate dehydrogenase [Sediminibacterium sp.]MBW0178452.1 UDP-N-acetylmuramate dehydrogenase [Sediminibacterium sp.]